MSSRPPSEPSGSPPRVAIVTVTYNSAAVIDAFLACVAAQTFSDAALVVVDNASRDDTLARARARAPRGARIIANAENRGVAAGNNQGIRVALEDRRDFILLLNNDTEFEPELVAVLVDEARRLRADMLTPLIVHHDDPELIWCAGGGFRSWQAHGTFHFGAGRRDLRRFSRPKRVSYSPTCCMLVRSELFQSVGLMDEKYFVYFDDTDFCLRARRAQARLWYTPATRVRHKVSALTAGDESAFSLRFMTRNKVYFIRRHFSAWTVPFWLAAYQARLLLFGLTPRGRRSWPARQRAFREGMRL